ncbi:MAG: hypothetical protein U5K71_07280 [Gracilimonas sp.]|nr:hypothetical protein [Gracilimonas sp.]
MEPVQWVDLVVVVTLLISMYTLFRQYMRRRSLVDLYFGSSALILFVAYSIHLLELQPRQFFMNWGKLISITFYISGLLVLIRESKPSFARFPLYLTALPFISFIFFPLIIDSIVIKDLVNGIYQGGALIVTILVFTINKGNVIGRRYYISGLTLVSIAFILFWFVFNREMPENIWISEILFSVGILLVLYRFIHSNSTQTNN